jgi:ComF family protein
MEVSFRSLAGLAVAVVHGFVNVPRCAGCGERLGRVTAFCGPCAATIVRARAEILAPSLPLRSFALYGGALADAILTLKYRDRPDLARPLGELLAQLDRLRCDLVVPVPLHPRRLAERGYNQAALLARPLARRLGVPFRPRALRRARLAAPQASLDRAKRLAIAGAFTLAPGLSVAGQRVLLVDDVATTGATLAGCAAPLYAAGALQVEAAVLARRERLTFSA